MTLLDQIQDESIDGSVKVDQVLRRCLVLASRLRYKPLEDWVRAELNGYNPDDVIPDYRVVHATVKFSGMNRRLRFQGQVMPVAAFPPNLQGAALEVTLRHPIGGIEGWTSDQWVNVPLPAAIYAFVESSLADGGFLTAASHEISSNTIVGLLSVIRNRILDFCLQIEQEVPDLEELLARKAEVPLTPVDEAFQIIVLGQGNVVNVGGGTGIVQNINQAVTTGDRESLLSFLKDKGVQPGELAELEEVLEEAKPGDLKNEQSRLRRWIDNAADTMATSGKGLTVLVGKEIATQAVRHFFGEVFGTPGPPTPGPAE